MKIKILQKILRLTLLGSSIALMLPGARGNSVTVVELALLPAGLAVWQDHSLGIYRVCGPLSKCLYSLPAYLAGIRIQYPKCLNNDTKNRHEWNIGIRFQKENINNYQVIYFYCRIIPILITTLGGCLVCEWSSRLFGTWPGIVSLGVWCWMAPFLAHGGLATSDMASAVLTIIAARTFWAFLIRPSVSTMLASGAGLGLAQATKFTLLILTPCWAVLLLFRAIQLGKSRISARREAGAGDQRVSTCSPLPITRVLSLSMGILVVSVVVIDASYGFQGVGYKLSVWDSGISSLARDVQGLAKSPATSWLLQIPLPIPIELLLGLDAQLADTERLQSAYLLGQTRLGGWWYWYALAALIKVPIPALILYVKAVARTPAGMRGRDNLFWASLCLLVPAAEIFLVVSATTGTGTNAAFRYLLPSFALLCVWLGLACRGPSKIGTGGIAVLLAWLFAGAVFAAPDHLGWRNELGWVADQYLRKPPLIGDSLDWGQDLLRLGSWVTEHSGQGNTVVFVYGLGLGEPFGLRSPAVQSNWKGAAFVAVSDNVLFGYESSRCVSIHDRQAVLRGEQRELLQKITPFTRVGRTIRIYRVRDLPARLFSDSDTDRSVQPR